MGDDLSRAALAPLPLRSPRETDICIGGLRECHVLSDTVNMLSGIAKTTSDQQRPCKALCGRVFVKASDGILANSDMETIMSSKRWCMHSIQAHRRLVLLVDLLAMGP